MTNEERITSLEINNDLILKNTQEILAILKNKSTNGFQETFENTGDVTPSKVGMDAFTDWFEPMFELPEGTVIPWEFNGKSYGYFSPGVLGDLDVLYWYFDGLNGTEIFGKAADLRSLADDIYPMFGEYLSEIYGVEWKRNYQIPDQEGMSTFETGIPYRFPCELKSLNELK